MRVGGVVSAPASQKRRGRATTVVQRPVVVNKPAGDARGNSQNEELSLEMEKDLSEVSLLLHNGNKVFPYLPESIWRTSVSAAVQRGTVEMGISEDEPPSAPPEKLDSELEPSCLCSILSTLLHAHPQIFLNDETKCVLPGHSEPMFSEQGVEYKKMLSRVKSRSDDLQITLALLALHTSELADLLCRS
ncbi:LOW QUALITY PROTEIN: protein FAM220A-like [Hippopotamus amphibius kiboko]|uniref:LOW QUALITY PROTEIN: protein FAM220A-like n=1 Tax=Hippopotamus amphibius kiboko TaxID=575201 RepID=UPI0025914D79|nr:LOW QUALITY PROTEIN: protein FAM220A-like [Hippopotamus amphibius kiboko]